MNEVWAALYNKLTGAGGLTALLATPTSVFDTVAPRGAAFPFVVFHLQSGGDDNQTPSRMKDLFIAVKGVSETGFKQAGAIDAQIDAALHMQELTVTGWTSIWLARVSDIRYQHTTKEGLIRYHVGGVYRLRLDS